MAALIAEAAELVEHFLARCILGEKFHFLEGCSRGRVRCARFPFPAFPGSAKWRRGIPSRFLVAEFVFADDFLSSGDRESRTSLKFRGSPRFR